MRLLLLILLLGIAGWFAPQFAEDTEAPCQALEKRIGTLVKDRAGGLPGGAPGGLAGAVQALLGASGGTLAHAYVRDRFPNLPPAPACVVAWWKLKIDPDLTTLLPPKQ